MDLHQLAPKPSHALHSLHFFPQYHLLHLPIIFTKYHAYVFSFILITLTAFAFSLLRPSFDPRPLLRSHPIRETCDYSDGKWVFDEGYPLRVYTEDCPFLDPGFQCHRNGRIDEGFRKWRWQPHGCDLPRFNASDLLQRSRNGRIIFAGDSIVRNQWESMLCMLSQGVPNVSNIYEENGSPITKHKGFLSFRFQEYNLTVEYYRVPFLVRISRPPPNSPPQVRGAIRIDKLHWFSNKWSGADILIFSGGHWWTEDKTTKAGAYFQEGQELNMTMDYKEAFYRTLKTLKAWAMQNLDPLRAHIFLRSYSSIHFRNGTWDQGGTCKDSNQPQTDSSNFPTETPFDQFIYGITKEMEVADRKAKYLNITYLTKFRSDGHPSTHREEGTIHSAIEDCSHWCLPGVPDTWNEILYAHLLIENFITDVKNDM